VVREVLEGYLHPEKIFQNVVVKGPGNTKKTKKFTLAEIDLLLSTDKQSVIVEVGSEKDEYESKPDMFSRKFYHLSKAIKVDEIAFLEFNGGLIKGIEKRKYKNLSSDSPDIFVGVGSVHYVSNLSYYQLLNKIEELKMKADVPFRYYQRLIN